MRKVDLLEDLQLVAMAEAADVVAHSPTPSIVSTAALSKGEGKNARSGVAQMVLAKQQLLARVELGGKLLQLALKQALLE